MKAKKAKFLAEFESKKILGLNKIMGGAAGLSNSTGDNDCTTVGGVGADCTDYQTDASSDTQSSSASNDPCGN